MTLCNKDCFYKTTTNTLFSRNYFDKMIWHNLALPLVNISNITNWKRKNNAITYQNISPWSALILFYWICTSCASQYWIWTVSINAATFCREKKSFHSKIVYMYFTVLKRPWCRLLSLSVDQLSHAIFRVVTKWMGNH